jgi:ABC-type spermidine/putrescine transport system permease subunit II
LPTTKWSLKWYGAFFSDPRWTAGLQNSLIVGGLTIALALRSLLRYWWE